MNEQLGEHVLHVLELLLDDVRTDADRDESTMVAGEFLSHGYRYQIQVKVTRNEEDFRML